MASNMSERELRLRRRENQKLDEERKRKEEIERDLILKEMELIRKQREETRRERERLVAEASRIESLEPSFYQTEGVHNTGQLDNTLYKVVDETGEDGELNDNRDESHSYSKEKLGTQLLDIAPRESGQRNPKTQSKEQSSFSTELNKSAIDSNQAKSRRHDAKQDDFSTSLAHTFDDMPSFFEEHFNIAESEIGALSRNRVSTERKKPSRKAAYKSREEMQHREQTPLELYTGEIKLDMRETSGLERKIKTSADDRAFLEDEGKFLKYDAVRRIKQKENELERILKEQEEHNRHILMEQRALEKERLFEKEIISIEVQNYKRYLLEEKMRSEAEMQRNQELLEIRLRAEIEARVRREMEEHLEEKFRIEAQEKRHMQIEEQSQKRKEREMLLKIKREKQREEELELTERIAHLKSLERDIVVGEVKESDNEASEDEEDRIIQERLEILKKEMENLQDRVQKKSKVLSKQKKINTEKTALEKPFGKPKLPQFDGSQFEEWKLEITSLMESGLYQDYVLAQTVRNSITAKARKVLQTLRPSASTKEIMKKMEDIYGNIRSGDSIIHEFYSARQNETEGCSEWGVRIETLFNQALERGEIEECRKDKKLKERFWRGLWSEKIKLTTRASYESTDSFDILRRKARIEEMEMKLEITPVKPPTTQQTTQERTRTEDIKICQPLQKTDETKEKMDKLLKKMEELEKEIRDVKRNQHHTENIDRGRDTFDYAPRQRSFRGGYRQRGSGRYRYRGGYGDNRSNEESTTSQRSGEQQQEESSKTKQTAQEQEKDTKNNKKDLN